MDIKTTLKTETTTITSVHADAFGDQAGPVISKLVSDLLEDPSAVPFLSLGAYEAGAMTGHILFTRARLTDSDLAVSLLAPLAIRPAAQGLGIGQALIREGLARLKATGIDLVFVLGHPGYYPKAGFTPAGALGFDAPYPIPKKDAGAWMVHDLGQGIPEATGTVLCARALDRPEHWRE